LLEAIAVEDRLTRDLLPPRGTSGRVLFHELRRCEGRLYHYPEHEREAVLAELGGPSEYVRRPLTVTGTNLLRLPKHLATSQASYLGEVLDRP